MEQPNVELELVIKPWWKRFHKALELMIFGSVLFEGKIKNVREAE